MIKLPSGVHIEEIPLDKRYRSNLRGLLTRIRKLYEALEDRFGEDGLELIREVSMNYGGEIAERVRKREGEPGSPEVPPSGGTIITDGGTSGLHLLSQARRLTLPRTPIKSLEKYNLTSL